MRLASAPINFLISQITIKFMLYVSGVDYSGKTFKPGETLSQQFTNCNFHLAILNGVRLVGTFTGCKFSSAEIRHADIQWATFINCSFIGANFKDGKLRDTAFNNCDFGGASMFNMVGVSSCKFHMDCKGVLGLYTDLAIKLIGSKQVYTVIPKDVCNMANGKPKEFDLNSFKPVVGSVHGHLPNRGPGQYSNYKVTPHVSQIDTLVDPEWLPVVDHYRSPPSKILKSKKPRETQGYAEFDDDECYYGGYPMMQRGSWHTYIHNEEYKYGYIKNAVLECSDVEEFKKCLS